VTARTAVALVVFAASAVAPLLSQSTLQPRRPPVPLPEEWWTGKIDKPLKCSSREYPAILGFDFRYWTGIDFTLDLKQFLPLRRGRRMYVLFRVTPEGRASRYFWQRQFIPAGLNLPPDVKLKDIQITVGGGVHLGVGKYRIDAIAVDQDGRACRERWNVNAKAIAEPLRQEPLTVETLPPSKPREPSAPTQRVAIVANADTFGPRRYGSKLSARDRSTLIDSLQSLAATWDTADFSLDLLDIERRRVLLSAPRLEPATFDKLDQSLRGVDTLTVDLESLKRGARGAFLSRFIEENMSKWAGFDAVIFIGPAWRWFDRLPDEARRRNRDLPKLYHLAMTPFRLPPANLIKQFVDSQDGMVLNVNQPADLARGIKRIRQHDKP